MLAVCLTVFSGTLVNLSTIKKINQKDGQDYTNGRENATDEILKTISDYCSKQENLKGEKSSVTKSNLPLTASEFFNLTPNKLPDTIELFPSGGVDFYDEGSGWHGHIVCDGKDQ